jgi:hypothetical protein
MDHDDEDDDIGIDRRKVSASIEDSGAGTIDQERKVLVSIEGRAGEGIERRYVVYVDN